ncbi:sialidase family protein [Adhaeribacter radiodurans]|uniref:Exo-alpha-sialidase n=1 Tax=Adhaeribacter radiodurans TaxID=2745197 RepID=A0A7L7LEI3_9BACT|nr:sialidase family protein [Adhaeribacter radiodurans]QMU31231.1 exo-alpha-sialidase [Adhaeribacter radiodurans]
MHFTNTKISKPFKRRLIRHKALLYILSLLVFTQCKDDSGKDPGPVNPPTNTFHPDEQPPVDNTRPTLIIQWETTATKLSHEVYSAEYGRIRRIKGDTLLLTYHFGPQGDEWDNIALKRSIDGGLTWSEPEVVMTDNDPNYYGFSNPEIFVARNGDVLLAYTGRGRPDDNAHANIQVRISKDRGWTFGTPVIINTGRAWEPALIQLPSGEIDLLYSSEANWWPSSNPQQEIRLVTSSDNGLTWGASRSVAYTSGARDGMAVPLVLKDNKGIVFPIESVNNSKSPWVVWSSVEANFNYASAGTTQNNRRWLATTENIWGGAPFIIQLPTGETILSCQDAGGRSISSDWKKNTMLVLAGNSIAQNFTNITYPWPNLPPNEGAYYSSLFLRDDSTLVLVTTRNFANGHSEIYQKIGHIQR